MKQALKLFTLSLCILLCTQCKSEAQQYTKDDLTNSTPQQRATLLTDTMSKVLNLSTDQYSKVYAVNLEIANKVQSVMKSNDNRMSKFQQMKSLQDNRDAALKGVLTDDQFALYKKKIDEMQKAMRSKYESRKNE